MTQETINKLIELKYPSDFIQWDCALDMHVKHVMYAEYITFLKTLKFEDIWLELPDAIKDENDELYYKYLTLRGIAYINDDGESYFYVEMVNKDITETAALTWAEIKKRD